MTEFTYQGRIVISKSKADRGFKKNLMAGVLLSMEGQPDMVDTDEWENVQCEIIIRPIKSLGIAKTKGLRVDQAIQAVSDDSQWLKTH
jgi:hypothetical protein